MNTIIKPQLFIISGPSGVGKSTLCSRLLISDPNLELSVSFTTRTIREGEEDGQHYFFVSDEIFDRMIDNREFAEWAEVHGNRYGTSVQMVENTLLAGRNLLFDIDCQGAKKLQERWTNTTSVFILPPAMELLEDRLRGRQTDSEKVIQTRLGNARDEIAQYKLFDFLLINNVLAQTFINIESIYRSGPWMRAKMSIFTDQLLNPNQP